MNKKRYDKIYSKFLEIVKEENVVFEIVPIEEIGSNKSKQRDKWACGVYISLSDTFVNEFQNSKLEWENNRYRFCNDEELKTKVKDIDDFYTTNNYRNKIQVDKAKQNTFSFIHICLHELGHHFDRDNVKTKTHDERELTADRYLYTFFKKYMPYYYLLIYKIEIEVYSEVKYRINYWKVLTSYIKETIR